MICSFIFLISQLQRNLFPKTLQVPDIQAIISYPLCLTLVVGDYFVGYNDDSISGEKEFSSNDFCEAVRLFFRGNYSEVRKRFSGIIIFRLQKSSSIPCLLAPALYGNV